MILKNINDLIGDVRQLFILHIPHSGVEIPDKRGFDVDLIESEIQLLTDHKTDEIFNIEGVDRIVVPYSRIFCDVERLPDEEEPMFKVGRGFYYTHVDSGKPLRILDEEHKIKIKEEYYDTHHKKLSELVSKKLEKHGMVYIVDCHSFPNEPLNTDQIKDVDRPDICLGVDETQTPKWLVNMFTNYFKYHGLSVDINQPYNGTIIPKEYKGNTRVSSIMIEVNRNLYMEGNSIDEDKVLYLKEVINGLMIN